MDSSQQKVEMVNVELLGINPRSEEVYGRGGISELADAIKKSGWLNPLVANDKNILVSGHRRMYACILLGIKEVPVKRMSFESTNYELRQVLIENEHKEKTNFQRTKEGQLWEEIIGLNDKQTREIVAHRIGIGSRATYERARIVVEEIDRLRQQNRECDAEFLKIILNENVRGAKDITEANGLDIIPKELKEKLVKKEIPLKQAVKEVRKCLGIVTDHKKASKKEVCQLKAETRIAKKEEIKSMNLEAMQIEVKDINRDVKDINHDTTRKVFCSNIYMSIGNMNAFVEMPDAYLLSEMDDNNKEQALKSISDMEEIINKLKKILI